MKKRIRAFERRVTIQWLIRELQKCALLGLGVSAVFLLLSFVFPIEWAWFWAVIIWLAVMLLSTAVLLIMRPKKQAMARAIDKYGCQERLQTMWALREEETDFARLQREETERFILTRNPKEMIPLEFSRRLLGAAGAGLLVCAVLCLLPSPQDSVLEERQQIRTAMQSQAVKLEQTMEALADDDKLSAEAKDALNEKLKELREELRQGTDYKEGIKKISELQKSVDELTQEQLRKQAQKQTEQLKESLAQSENEAVQELADKLDADNPETVKEALEEVMEEAVEEVKEVAEAIKEAAESAENEEIQEALEELAEALESMDEAALQEALDQYMQGGGQSSGLIELNDQLSLSKSQMSQLSQSTAFNGDPSSLTGGEGKDGTGNGEGESSGQGSGSGSGQGSGQGTGTGQGSGQGGSGQGAGQGAGAGTGELVDAEKVYDDSRLDETGNETNITGEVNEDGSRAQGETNAGEGSLDGYIPYKEVAGSYGDEAVNAGKRAQLPPAEQSWVEKYFSSLLD